MSNFTLAIIGTGVVGASLGLALKRDKDAPYLIGHDKVSDTTKAAVKMGALDKAEWNLINACESADVIILALPFSGIRPTLEAIAPYLKPGVVITDTARSKVPVLAWAKELLPPHVHFIGGDPLVHTAGTGHPHATADLFRERLYCLTPAVSAAEEAVELMVGLVSMLGAKPFFLDAAEHDGLTTAVDILPSLVGASLMQTVVSQPSWREMRKVAGALFEQATAGAGDDPASLRDNLLANRADLLIWLDRYLEQLHQVRTLLTSPDDSAPALTQLLEKAATERVNWLLDTQQSRFDDPEMALPPIEQPGLMRRLIGLGGPRKQ